MKTMPRSAVLVCAFVFPCALVSGGCRKQASSAQARKRFTIVNAGGARLQLRGTLEARDLAVIANPSGLAIARVRHGDGEPVAKGDVILELEVSRTREDLARRREELRLLQGLSERERRVSGPRERADAVERLAQLDLEIRRTRTAVRLEEILAKRGVVESTRPSEAQERLQRLLSLRDEMARALEVLEEPAAGTTDASRTARILDLERTIAEQERLLAEAVVVAPAAGRVRALQPLRPGPTQPGPLLSVFDPNALRVTATLWQNQFVEVDVGTECVVRPDFIPDRQVGCRIASKDPYGTRTTDPATGMEVSRFAVKLDLVGSVQGLLPGMTATITFPGEAGVSQVPKEFVGEDAGKRFVLVEKQAGPPDRVAVDIAPGWAEGFLGVRGLEDGVVLVAPAPAR
jgi:hypothetical protein